ncbi:MAG: RnfABCDGE type electron transport complex subunit G [Oscillospiraceae bacterium]|jgi:electron transport complex protein RnfG|nr:RnfABCDGE type electron transport complex subunit G [Oscillospiraceae bacterium]
MKTLKDILIPTIALFLICFLVTALLGTVNLVTEPIIAETAAGIQDEACGRVLQGAAGFESIDETAYKGVDTQGKTVGYVIIASSTGYGGEIKLMVGINAEGVVQGVEILSMSETPGLGANAKKDKFISQYKGKDANKGELKVSKDGGEIDAITAATISSRAVTQGVNQALERYKELSGKAGV